MTDLPPPIATYRLQLTPDFGFDAAAGIAPHLANLGVSHLYLSPIFEARPGSRHGYDQTDPTRIRAELGGEPAFDRLVDAAHASGLGIVLDIVPNHMAAHHDNPWWRDLLRRGPGSEFARYFDVDWDAAQGRIVLPVLGATLPEAIAAGDLSIETDGPDGPHARCFERQFPLRDDIPIPRGALSPEQLQHLLGRQHYALMYWRDGLRRINYRRFFDIADLAGLRVEDPAVFEHAHRKVLDLAARSRIDCVRIDHIDGLRDPAQYLVRLREALDHATPPGSRVGVLVEKILAADESLPPSWPIDGATGYEFLAAAAALATDPAGVEALRRHALAHGAAAPDFGDLAVECKREAAESLLAPELDRLCAATLECLRAARQDRDEPALRRALVELSAALPVYRTYADDRAVPDGDLARIRDAAGRASQRPGNAAIRPALDGLVNLLTFEPPFGEGPARSAAVEVIRLWQQFTGPLAAKGVEDTALYRDIACPALNDVGTEPIPTAAAPALERLAAQRRHFPGSLNATDTHDAKRSEDVRARLAALTHHPRDWIATLDAVVPALRACMRCAGAQSPSGRDLSLIIHSAFALWPIGELPDGPLAARLEAYIVKAAREAKQRSHWTSPDADYEAACADAIKRLLFSPSLENERTLLAGLARATRPLAARQSIGVLLLKALFPGVPDFYQGTECRALSLVDPDNRRPVNFTARRDILADIRARWRHDPTATAAHLLHDPDTDAAKLFATWRVLAIRRRLLASGDPLGLDSVAITASQWRWVVSAGPQRCIATIRPKDAAPDLAPTDPVPPGVDQLAAATLGAHSHWVSVVCDGVVELW